jgi:cytochrome P450
MMSPVAPEPRTPDWDPLSLDVEPDPTGAHARLRRECPVAYSDRFGGFWTLTRYDDVVAVARDVDTYRSSEKTTIPDSAPGRPPRPPLESDPPEHSDYRRVLNPYFLPRRMRALEPAIRRLADELLDGIVGRGPVDFVTHFSNPYPVSVLCAFLGLPQEHWAQIKAWANDVLRAGRAEDRPAQLEANRKFYAYVEAVVEQRAAGRRDPRDDVISGLLSAHVNGSSLSHDGVAGVIRLLLQAGHGTTTNGLGSAVRYLAEDPQLQAQIRQNPGMVPLFVEEVLRMWTPARLLARTASRDTNIHGRTIRKGEKIALMWSAANRDASVFDDSDGFHIRRPNRHVAFGYGIHTCLGGPLARTELRVAVERILARTSSIASAGPAEMAPWPHIGPRTLPLELLPPAAGQ